MGDPAIHVRTHGRSGRVVIALHGGPAASGSAGEIARGLAGRFRVLEPWQRGSGDEPLTVARHVADLRDLIVRQCHADAPPALVGESWGAMLALAFAAAHPELAGPIVLVACGTFGASARQRMRETIEQRTDEPLRRRLAAVEQGPGSPGEKMRARFELIARLYDFDPIELPADDEAAGQPFDAAAHEQTWRDMLRLQAEGVYPAAFAAIRSPVLMLHGDHDPHPGAMIRDSLRPALPQLEYRELSRCGHRPWAERHARETFFATLGAWLADRDKQ